MRLREHEGIIPGRIDILYAKPDAIMVEEGYNVRDLTTPEARAELDELKAQVREAGILTPLKVRFDGENIILVEGHRRRLVALELIEEYRVSKGREGRNIEAVPIFPEAPGTTVEERDAGLQLSNSGTRLKPLELANLIYRMHATRGLPHEAVAKMLGISMQVLRNHLAMRAMPEPVKEQVREGTISATEAAKVVKNLPKGTDPTFAADLIAKNREENKKLGVGKKTNHKVTAKTLKRDAKPKAPEPVKEETKAYITIDLGTAMEVDTIAAGSVSFSPLSDATPPAAAPTRTEPRTFPPEALQPPSSAADFDREMFAIVARLATIGEGHDLNALADDHLFEVPAEVIKAADRAYRSRIGDVS